VQSFPPETAVPVLRRLLADQAKSASWPNAAAMLGMIGSDADADVLIDVSRRPMAVDAGVAARTRASALLGLGYLTQARGTRAALDYLGSGLDPVGWQRRDVSGTDADQAAIVSALALGLTGRPQARTLLDTAARQPLFQGSAGSESLAEANRTHGLVAQQGLLRYYKLEQQPNLQRFRPGQLDRVLQPARPEPATLPAAAAASITRPFAATMVEVPGKAAVVPPQGASAVLPTPPVQGVIPNPGQNPGNPQP
jgi:hypothetical protein